MGLMQQLTKQISGGIQRLNERVQKALGYEVGEPTPELIAHNQSNTEWWGLMFLGGVFGACAFELDRQVDMYVQRHLSGRHESAATSGSSERLVHQSVFLGDLSRFLNELDPNMPQQSDEAFRIARDLMMYEEALRRGLRAEDDKMSELLDSLRDLRGKLSTTEPGLKSSINYARNAIISYMQQQQRGDER